MTNLQAKKRPSEPVGETWHDLFSAKDRKKKRKQVCERTKLQLRECLAIWVLWAFTLDTFLKEPGPCCLATVGREKVNSRSLYCLSRSQRPTVSLLLSLCQTQKHTPTLVTHIG